MTQHLAHSKCSIKTSYISLNSYLHFTFSRKLHTLQVYHSIRTAMISQSMTGVHSHICCGLVQESQCRYLKSSWFQHLVKCSESHSVVSNSLRPHGLQAPLSMKFSRQEYWSGLPFLSEDILKIFEDTFKSLTQEFSEALELSGLTTILLYPSLDLRHLQLLRIWGFHGPLNVTAPVTINAIFITQSWPQLKVRSCRGVR